MLPGWWLAFGTPWEPLPEEPVSDLDRSLDLLLPHEGKWSDHPNDRGGKTMYGITIGTFRAARRLMPDLPEHLRDLTPDGARRIYERMFWADALADRLPWPVCYAQFDAAVQHSPLRAIRLLQEAVGVSVDGVPGPETRGRLKRLSESDGWALPARDMLVLRGAYYIRILADPTQADFAKGWSNRLRDVWRVTRAA